MEVNSPPACLDHPGIPFVDRAAGKEVFTIMGDTQTISTGGGPSIGTLHLPNGDFISRDQNNYYLKHVSLIFARTREDQQPYFAGRPFHTADGDLFTGRSVQVGTLLEYIRDPTLLAAAVYGPADVGKTSFVSAGVLPNLNDIDTDLFPLRDYNDATSLLTALLRGHAKEMHVNIAGDAPIPQVTQAILQNSSRRMLWFFDQFERFFLQDLSEQEVTDFYSALGETIEEVDPTRFQIVIAIRDDWQATLDRQFGDLLPGLQQARVHLNPLKRNEAKLAIMHPTEMLGIQPVFDEDFLEKRLLDDLESLSVEGASEVLPADLQIVCHHLFQKARAQHKQVIKADFYYAATEDKGAEWILDDHFRGLMDRVTGAQRSRAAEIGTEVLVQGPRSWVTVDSLEVAGSSPSEIAGTLEEMAHAELLVWHLSGEQRAYAFAGHSIAEAAMRALGREAQKRLQAQRELDYVWRDWVASDDTWASRYQLNLLEDQLPHRPFPPERILVVLRSAVTRATPVQPWLARLTDGPGHALLSELEENETASEAGATRSTAQSQAGRILGLFDAQMPTCPSGEGIGQVSWDAAVHKQIQARETAALALASVYGATALERVEAAVTAAGERSVLKTSASWRRLAELRGILADAREEIAEELRQKRRRERLAIWWWRFRRRVRRDARYIVSLVLGGAIGAGIGLGVLRAVMSPLLNQTSGFFFYSYFPTGFLLGGAVALGLVLVEAIRLLPREPQGTHDRARPARWSVGLGALFFAVMHVLLMLILQPEALFESPLIPPLALVAGAGLSAVVYDQPMAGWRLGVGRWLRRLALVAAVFALVQGVFVTVDLILGPDRDMGTGLMFAWSGYTYQSGLSELLRKWGFDWVLTNEYWYHAPAVIDAAMTGIVLMLGLTAGLIVAAKSYWNWEVLLRQANRE